MSGKLANGSYSSLYLISAFSTVLQSIDYVVTCQGLARRVMEVHNNNILAQNNNNNSPPPPLKNQQNDTTFAVKIINVTVFSPRQITLINNLNINITHGMRVLITGKSGCGKSTLLKFLAENITDHQHVVFNCAQEHVYFCSQSPYLFTGSLTENVVYNHKNQQEKSVVVDIHSLLAQVKFNHVIPNPHDKYNNNNNNNSLSDNVNSPLLSEEDGPASTTDAVFDWHNILSSGEKQKIAIARILYNQPKILFVDECTSSMDEEEEDLIYHLLTQQIPTIISVGHRTTIKKFHTHELHINHNGTYSITTL